MNYKEALIQIQRIIDNDQTNAIERVVHFLHKTFVKYSWVGVYFVQGNDLILGPWKGPDATEHTSIPIGDGICGATAVSGVTEIIDDVNADPRDLACFVSTRSEIVVPIKKGEVVVGEIDIDSDEPGAFTRDDVKFLEKVAHRLSKLV